MAEAETLPTAKVLKQGDVMGSDNDGDQSDLYEDNFPGDEAEDSFPVLHKYGWTVRSESVISHHKVTNPEAYFEGCRGKTIMGWGKDGAYDLEVEIVI